MDGTGPPGGEQVVGVEREAVRVLGSAKAQPRDAAAIPAGLAAAVGIFNVLAAKLAMRASLPDHSASLNATPID
jgi:hypothetical protein